MQRSRFFFLGATIVLLAVLNASDGEPQDHHHFYPPIMSYPYFLPRVDQPIQLPHHPFGRLVFGLIKPVTFTVYTSTATSTSTVTVATTCTTSTAALPTCTVGRRRRGIFYDEDGSRPDRLRRGLLYSKEEDDQVQDQTLPSDSKANEPVGRVGRQSMPFPIESTMGPYYPPDVMTSNGYEADGSAKRFFLVLGTTTLTTTTTTTSTATLTAVCASTTSFSTC